MDIFNLIFWKPAVSVAESSCLSRDIHVYSINVQSSVFLLASCSVPLTKYPCVWHIMYVMVIVMSEKQVFWSLYLWKNKRSGLWVKDHIWHMDSTKEKRSIGMCVCVCVSSFCCVKDSLTERWGIRRLWEWPTPNDSPVKHCTIVCKGMYLQPPGPESELLFGQGNSLWSPVPLTLWSIHPIMNEEVVKGGKAGVHLCLCVCACVCVCVHTSLLCYLEIS